MNNKKSIYALIDGQWIVENSIDEQSSESADTQQQQQISTLASSYSISLPPPNSPTKSNQQRHINILTTADQWYEYYARLYPSHSYLQRIAKLKQKELDKQRRQQRLTDSEKKGGWFSKLFGGGKSTTDDNNTEKSPDTEEQEVETDDNTSTSSNDSTTQFQDGLRGSTSPQTSSSNNSIPNEAISFHRFHLVSESCTVQSNNSQCVVLPVRSAVGYNNTNFNEEGEESRDLRYCIVGYGQIAEFLTLDSESNDVERTKVTLTSDWQHLSSIIQPPQNHQQSNKILHDIRHCRASCIGNDLLMVSWGRGDGWVVFYHRVKPTKRKKVAAQQQGNGSLEVGWEVVAVASPSQAVVRAGIKNMTHALYEQRPPTDVDENVEEKEITVEDERRLHYSGSLYVTDLLPMVIDNASTDGKADDKPHSSAVLAISRLGGYVELIPLPNWLWQTSSNYEIPKLHNNRGILNLSLLSHTTALSTRDDQLDVLALDAYRTSNEDGENEGNKEVVLVTSGSGGDGMENMTFWGVTTLHDSYTEGESAEKDSFEVQVRRLGQYAFDNIGSDVSLFVTDMTTDYWFVADESLSRLSKRRKVNSSACTVMTVSAPVTTLRFTPSIQHHEGRVLLAALDYNGGVSVVDCTQMIHPSADSDQVISLLCSRERMMHGSLRGKSQFINASQIEWWSDNKEDGSFTLASYATLPKRKTSSRSKKGILRLQQLSDNDDPPDEIICIPIPNNASVSVFSMATKSGTLPLLQLSHSNSSCQLSMCGVQKYDDPSEITTSLLRRENPEKALEVVHNVGNAQNFGGRVMDECHIQLWESQYDVQALKSISNDEYVIGEVMQLVKFTSNDDRVSNIDLNCLTLDNLLEVYKEGLTRCTASSEESYQLSNALQQLGTFYLLVKHYAAATKELSMNETSSLSSLYTKRFLYEFQTIPLVSVATCAASKGDIDALTILLSRHHISTYERMKILDCIPHEIGVATYAHLLPCYSDTEESAQFLPRSGSNTRFVNTSQLFAHLIESSRPNEQHSSTEQGYISPGVCIDDNDRSNVILNLEQDSGDVVTTSTRDDIASWYIKRALDTHYATGQVVLMQRVCEAGLIRLGFVSFEDDGTYELANLENADAGGNIVSKLVYLYYASSLFSQILIDKMKGSLSTETSLPAMVEKWNDLYMSVIQFCSMNLSQSVVPFIVENSEHQYVSMYEKHVVNFADGSKRIKPRNEDTSLNSSKEEDMAIILEENMMKLCINKVKTLVRDKSSNATALEDTLSMCVDFASYVDGKSTFGRIIDFIERILHAVLEVMKSGYFLPTKVVMNKLWLCFELLPSNTGSEERTRVNGLHFRLVALQLCCKWLGHQAIPHDLLEVLNDNSNLAKDLCLTGCIVISFVCDIFCDTTKRISTSDSTGQQDLLFDFVSDVDEFDKRFFSSGIQQSGRLEHNLVAPLLLQHSFTVLQHLLKLRPDWFTLESTHPTVLSFMRDCDEDNAILACQEMLGPILFHNSFEIEYQQRERDAKQFVLQAMQLDQSLLDKLFSSTTDYSTKPIVLIQSLLALRPETILLGCEFWGDEVGSSNACTDAALYFTSQIRLDERLEKVEANHILPPMPGALVMQLSNIIGLHKPQDLLLVKRCMAKGALRMNLGSAAAAICCSMLCDRAFAIRDNTFWTKEQELQVLECVAAIVKSSSFHDSRIKKDLCTIALQLFSCTDVPVHKMIVDNMKQLEYELLSTSAIEQVPSNNFYCRSMITIFSNIKQSSQYDLLHLFSLTCKTTDESEKFSGMGKIMLQWAANEALKARDRSTPLCTSAAANILLVTEMGTRCLSEFMDHEAIPSIMNDILEDYSTSAQATKASIPNDSITLDSSLCQRLSDRGYGRNAARRAVIMTNNKGYSEALTWAIAHFQDDDFDSPMYYLRSDGSVHANQQLIDMTGELLRLVKDKSNSPKSNVKSKHQKVQPKKQFVSRIPSPSTSRATKQTSTIKKPSFVSKTSPFTSPMKSPGDAQ